MQNKVAWIGAELGWGAGKPEVEQAPRALVEAGLTQQYPFKSISTMSPMEYASSGLKKTFEEKMALIKSFNGQLADRVEQVCDQGYFPLVIGGDHAIAMGTWQGVKAGKKIENLGLIWIDAHLDAHTPETTPSKNIHGMPVATLLGKGDLELVKLKSADYTIKPEHIVMIGIRSADPGETKLIQSLGVRVYTMDEVKSRGIDHVMNEVNSLILSQTDGFGMSIDVDGFDPQYAPGTGTPEPNGLEPDLIIPHLMKMAQHPSFCALEIVEFNPTLDNDNKATFNLVNRLINELVFSKSKT